MSTCLKVAVFSGTICLFYLVLATLCRSQFIRLYIWKEGAVGTKQITIKSEISVLVLCMVFFAGESLIEPSIGFYLVIGLTINQFLGGAKRNTKKAKKQSKQR